MENGNFKIVTVRELLNENLKIPEYQRPYNWSTESAVILVNDLYEAFINKVPEYRIGSVILNNIINENKSTKLNIVDGQQRLTTISIMFFVFGELIKGRDYEHMSKLLDEEYNNLSSEAIVNNYDVIRRKIKDIDKKQLEEYIEYILENCTFVKIIVESEQEAFQFFDSQNSRGKELAPHDLLKSYHLREMDEVEEKNKVEIINMWENINQKKLKDFFADNLYPLVRWYKSKEGINYSIKQLKVFKGIKKNNNYNFSIYNKAANMYIEKLNAEGIYEMNFGKVMNQFQLTQPIIAGRLFFYYTLHYVKLYDEIDRYVKLKFRQEELIISGSGDSYVYNMFINAIIFYVDKFNIDSLTDDRLYFLYKWAFSLRLCMRAVYRESVNKYAQGKSDRINSGLNMFTLIFEMQEPMELDTIVLQNISEDKFENSKINVNRYRKMYDRMNGKEDK